MKKQNYSHINENSNKKRFLLFIQTFEETLFYYSFESYKLPALNSHFLCLDFLQTYSDVENGTILEGNFIPLIEEFENLISNDKLILEHLCNTDILFSQLGKNSEVINLKDLELKAKIKRYEKIAEYIADFSSLNSNYLSSILDLLIENIFTPETDTYKQYKNIYHLTRVLATDLVNSGYSQEYLYSIVRSFFYNRDNNLDCSSDILVEFFNKFCFRTYKYQVRFGVNNFLKNIYKQIDSLDIQDASEKDKVQFNLQHKKAIVVSQLLESLDEYTAAEKTFNLLNQINELHRLAQHHKSNSVKPTAEVSLIQDDIILFTKKITLADNVLLHSKNTTHIEALLYDTSLIENHDLPQTFFRAVHYHNSAIDSKEPSNQLLNLWMIIETLIPYKSGDHDRIVEICRILTTLLSKQYLYSQILQLYNDLENIIPEELSIALKQIDNIEKPLSKFAAILSLKNYSTVYDNLYTSIEDFPLLQYRLHFYSKEIFINTETVYNELQRHKKKIEWQIMRIYRNRNMIVHTGNHMPYISIILSNLHYYTDALLDTVMEYYHIGITDNQTIFFKLMIDELTYFKELGISLDKKNKKFTSKEITEENFNYIIFNSYEGNVVKNAIHEAINSYHTKLASLPDSEN